MSKEHYHVDCCNKCPKRTNPSGHIYGCKNYNVCMYVMIAREAKMKAEASKPEVVIPYDGSPATSTHYQSGATQPIQFMQESMSQEEFTGHCKCTALKYIARAGKKKGNPQEQDLIKAQAYIKWAIQSAKGEKITLD